MCFLFLDGTVGCGVFIREDSPFVFRLCVDGGMDGVDTVPHRDQGGGGGAKGAGACGVDLKLLMPEDEECWMEGKDLCGLC